MHDPARAGIQQRGTAVSCHTVSTTFGRDSAAAGNDAPLAVVTVTFSPGKHLAGLVDTLGGATARDTLLICADNGSTDGVPQAMAARRGDVEFMPTGGNIGYGAAINAAARHLAAARRAGEIDGEYFLIVNPDVEFSPGSLDALLNCAADHPRAGAVGPRIEELDGTAYPSAREVPTLVTGIGHAVLYPVWPGNPFSKAYKAGENLATVRPAGWLSGSCLLVRWDAFGAIGGFDERYFMYFEDIDFGDRLSRAGWDNIFCPDSVIFHDQGHSAKKHSRVTVPAHHDSAYRFQADRHPHLWQAPIRAALWLGLKTRAVIARACG